ncbi:hypothetical protein E2C01_051939 [Portunus trituberculatus]|uniref:Uncharacterized protein n=1 Tax=Portunus trituberculatus TaxID=210409 RepID=A0A5B7GL07_PORTR|nr:hypothetical protein [Portunus trituberculatus]
MDRRWERIRKTEKKERYEEEEEEEENGREGGREGEGRLKMEEEGGAVNRIYNLGWRDQLG